MKKNPAAVELGRKGGQAKTAKKAASSRENGKLGGRPKKKENQANPVTLQRLSLSKAKGNPVKKGLAVFGICFLALNGMTAEPETYHYRVSKSRNVRLKSFSAISVTNSLPCRMARLLVWMIRKIKQKK